jgi:hypothetical protein
VGHRLQKWLNMGEIRYFYVRQKQVNGSHSNNTDEKTTKKNNKETENKVKKLK